MVLGWLLGTQRVRLALLSQVFINSVNIVAVLLYVYVFDWGVAGIGAATATADALGFVLGAALLWHGRPRGLPALNRARPLRRAALKRLVVLNRDIFVRTLCLLSSFGWFAHLGARQGDATLAANALLLNFQTFMAYGLDGFAHAAEALVGAAIGARDRHAFTQAVKVTALWSALGALGFSLVYWGAGSWIIDRLTDQAAVRAVGRHVSAVGRALAGDFRVGLSARRRVHRRDPHARIDEVDGGVASGVRGGVVGIAGAVRQSRPVGRDADFHGRARHYAGALSAGCRARHGGLGTRMNLRARCDVAQGHFARCVAKSPAPACVSHSGIVTA